MVLGLLVKGGRLDADFGAAAGIPRALVLEARLAMAENEKNDPLTPAMRAASEAFSRLPKIPPISIPLMDLPHFAKVHKDARAVFPEVRKQFAAQSKQYAEFRRTLERIASPTQAAFQQMAETAKRIQSQFQPSPEALRAFEQVAGAARRQKALNRIGLLPHPSTPFALLDDHADDDTLKAAVEQHYHDKLG